MNKETLAAMIEDNSLAISDANERLGEEDAKRVLGELRAERSRLIDLAAKQSFEDNGNPEPPSRLCEGLSQEDAGSRLPPADEGVPEPMTDEQLKAELADIERIAAANAQDELKGHQRIAKTRSPLQYFMDMPTWAKLALALSGAVFGFIGLYIMADITVRIFIKLFGVAIARWVLTLLGIWTLFGIGLAVAVESEHRKLYPNASNIA